MTSKLVFGVLEHMRLWLVLKNLLGVFLIRCQGIAVAEVTATKVRRPFSCSGAIVFEEKFCELMVLLQLVNDAIAKLLDALDAFKVILLRFQEGCNVLRCD